MGYGSVRFLSIIKKNRSEKMSFQCGFGYSTKYLFSSGNRHIVTKTQKYRKDATPKKRISI